MIKQDDRVLKPLFGCVLRSFHVPHFDGLIIRYAEDFVVVVEETANLIVMRVKTIHQLSFLHLASHEAIDVNVVVQSRQRETVLGFVEGRVVSHLEDVNLDCCGDLVSRDLCLLQEEKIFAALAVFVQI